MRCDRSDLRSRGLRRLSSVSDRSHRRERLVRGAANASEGLRRAVRRVSPPGQVQQRGRDRPCSSPSSAHLFDSDVPGLKCRTEDPVKRRQRVFVVDERVYLGILRLDQIVFEAAQLKDR